MSRLLLYLKGISTVIRVSTSTWKEEAAKNKLHSISSVRQQNICSIDMRLDGKIAQ